MHAVIDDGKKRMTGALSSLTKEFARLRTGRASVSLIEPLMADYYGNPTPVGQIASLSTPDARTITIHETQTREQHTVNELAEKTATDLGQLHQTMRAEAAALAHRATADQLNQWRWR